MNNRIQQFIDAERLTPAKLADALGVQRSNISHILGGRNKPGFDFIEKMLKTFPQINPDWLILGKGNIYREAYAPSLFSEENSIKHNKNAITHVTSENINGGKEDLKDAEVKKLPFIPSHSSKTIERVIIFYTDNTFDNYTISKEK